MKNILWDHVDNPTYQPWLGWILHSGTLLPADHSVVKCCYTETVPVAAVTACDDDEHGTLRQHSPRNSLRHVTF